MDRKRPKPEILDDSVEESNTTPQAESATSMGRFKTLTRRLLNVPRKQIDDEQKRYEEKKYNSLNKNNRPSS